MHAARIHASAAAAAAAALSPPLASARRVRPSHECVCCARVEGTIRNRRRSRGQVHSSIRGPRPVIFSVLSCTPADGTSLQCEGKEDVRKAHLNTSLSLSLLPLNVPHPVSLLGRLDAHGQTPFFTGKQEGGRAGICREMSRPSYVTFDLVNRLASPTRTLTLCCSCEGSDGTTNHRCHAMRE